MSYAEPNPADYASPNPGGPRFTPGPWQWYGDPKAGGFYLATVGGGRRWVMGFRRLGMTGAQPTFQINKRIVPAADLCIFEVAPEATSADDPAVYRTDIIGFRAPDAHLIAAAPDLYAIATHPVLEHLIATSDHPSVAAIFEPMRRAALAKVEGRQP